jgi:2-polyprenyl-3-methyl-5-hydroxy-6-metoxy-1,4-benzoquinol methylase
MRLREEWEHWYQRPDPWDYEGTDEDLLRTETMLSRLCGRHFKRALDLGCGEGRLTNEIAGVADQVVGYDISGTAIQRARTRYPRVEFRQGDLMDVLANPEVLRAPFDLIVAAEVLYYLPTDEERMQALTGISLLGAPDCLYFFSVIVSGSSAGRRYFTHDGFLQMLAKDFQVIEHFPCAVQVSPVVDRVIHAMPFRTPRLSWRRRIISTSEPTRWKHVGYLARKRSVALP